MSLPQFTGSQEKNTALVSLIPNWPTVLGLAVSLNKTFFYFSVKKYKWMNLKMIIIFIIWYFPIEINFEFQKKILLMLKESLYPLSSLDNCKVCPSHCVHRRVTSDEFRLTKLISQNMSDYNWCNLVSYFSWLKSSVSNK